MISSLTIGSGGSSGGRPCARPTSALVFGSFVGPFVSSPTWQEPSPSTVEGMDASLADVPPHESLVIVVELGWTGVYHWHHAAVCVFLGESGTLVMCL
jgi:hypothetical protein